jgi:hypothetical protein
MKTTIVKHRNLLYGPIAFAVLLVAITVMLACQRQNDGAANTPQSETTPPTAQPSAAEQPSNPEASLAEQLNWSQITQNMGGPTFPQHFRASVTGGFLVASVLTTTKGAAAGLTFAPQQINQINWAQIPQNMGGTSFPQHFGASVPGGFLIASVLTTAKGATTGLAFVPQAVSQLTWSQITQNMGGPTFPQHFRASVPGGFLVISTLGTANGDASDIAFVPQQINQLTWAQIPQNMGGTSFPQHFGASVPGGFLVVSVLTTANGAMAGLTFAPQQINQLTWAQITQNMGGPTFPQHFKASVTGGSVFLSVINTANGNGGDLAFVR